MSFESFPKPEEQQPSEAFRKAEKESKGAAKETVEQSAEAERPEETEVPFNPEKDVKKEYWAEAKNYLEGHNVDNWYAEKVVQMKTLSPEKAKLAELDGEKYKELKLNLDNNVRKKYAIDRVVEAAANIKILFPEKASGVQLTKKEWQSAKDNFEYAKKGKDWGHLLAQAEKLRILSPDRFGELSLDDQVWSGVKEKLDKPITLEDAKSFAYYAAKAKSLFPKKAQSIKLSTGDWEIMKKALESLGEEKERTVDGQKYKEPPSWEIWEIYGRMAADMKILAE